MPVTAHITVRRFEMFLFFLNCCLLVLVGFYLWHRAWLFSVVMALFWMLTAMIGQALPHRKNQPGAEMAQGKPVDIEYGELRSDVALGLGKAVTGTSFLIGFVCLAIAWHEGWRWYLILAAGLAGYVFVFVATGILFAIPSSQRTTSRDFS